MTVPARRDFDNHTLSIFKFIKDNVETPYGIKVNYDDETYDVKGYNQWIDVSFLSFGAGRKDSTVVQFDVYSRIRGKIPGGDEQKVELSLVANKLYKAMHVDSIQVYDYTILASPVLISGAKLMIQNSSGTFREPESDQMMETDNDVARRSLTYRLRMVEDASNAPSYYD